LHLSSIGHELGISSNHKPNSPIQATTDKPPSLQSVNHSTTPNPTKPIPKSQPLLIPEPQNLQIETYKPFTTPQSTTAHEVVSLPPPKISSLLPAICAIN
jgi:hypothetical protein